jgi:hypothetical protein
MSAFWIVATPTTKAAYSTEQEAEREAAEMVKSKRATECVIYGIELGENG